MVLKKMITMKTSLLCLYFLSFLTSKSDASSLPGSDHDLDQDVLSGMMSQPLNLLEMVYIKLAKLELRFDYLEKTLYDVDHRLTAIPTAEGLKSIEMEISKGVELRQSSSQSQTEMCDVTLKKELDDFRDVIIDNITNTVTRLLRGRSAVGLDADKHYSSRGYITEYHDIFNTGQADYRLAFRGTAHVGTPLYLAYKDGAGIPSHVEDGCKSSNFSKSCFSHYRNNDALNNWCNIEEVVFGIVDDQTLVKTIRFNGADTTYMDWFQQKNLRESSYVDLKTVSKGYFSIVGDTRSVALRHFLINRPYGGCDRDGGWVTATDLHPACPWENRISTIPKLIYSGSNTAIHWNTGDRRDADAFVVFVKYRDS